jgi:hypothetical protein
MLGAGRFANVARPRPAMEGYTQPQQFQAVPGYEHLNNSRAVASPWRPGMGNPQQWPNAQTRAPFGGMPSPGQMPNFGGNWFGAGGSPPPWLTGLPQQPQTNIPRAMPFGPAQMGTQWGLGAPNNMAYQMILRRGE